MPTKTSAAEIGLAPPSPTPPTTGAGDLGLAAPPASTGESFEQRLGEHIPGMPVLGPALVAALPPAINFLDYPFRAVAGDLYATTTPALHRLATGKGEWFPSRAEWWNLKQKATAAGAIPETPAGEIISDILDIPGKVIGTAVPAVSEAVIGSTATHTIGPYATTAADIAGAFGGRLGFAERAGDAAAEDVARMRTQNRARAVISKAHEKGTRAGGPTVADAIDEMQRARGENQPLTLADIQNPEIRALIGTVYRQGGAARGIIHDFLEGRNVGQMDRVRNLIRRHVSDDSMRDAAARLLDERSAHGRALFDQAAEGGSLAPLEDQFRAAWVEAGRREVEAAQAAAQARHAMTTAGARQSVAGNVYSASAANTARRAAEAQERGANAALAQARADKATLREKLVRAQADRTANAPGAVWSPHLQRMLDLPEMKQALDRGYAMERRKAVAGDRPFDPRDYAIIGTDERGDPIVGAVPNMRLLMVAKEGLDSIISDHINPDTGRPDKIGQSFMVLRDGEQMPDGSVRGGFVPELDRLNPAYKAARDQWSGDTESFGALRKGTHIFDRKWFPTTEDVADYFNRLGTNDREFVKMGVMADLVGKLEDAPDAADMAKRVINNEKVRTRLRAVLGPEADAFIDAIERERVMRETPHKLYGGAESAERLADDLRAGGALNRAISGAYAAANLWHGNPLPAAAAGLRWATERAKRPDLAVNEEIARLAVDPTLQLDRAANGILPPQPVPAGPRPAVNAGSILTPLIGSALLPR